MLKIGRALIYSVFNRAFHTYCEMPDLAYRRDFTGVAKQVKAPTKMFVGLVPKSVEKLNFFLEIPSLFKPSPLSLIAKKLKPQIEMPQSHNFFVSFLDFDVF